MVSISLLFSHSYLLSSKFCFLDYSFLNSSYGFLEGRGSLLSFLKARGWATSLSAGVGDEGMHHSSMAYIFGMSMHLTDSGLEKVPFFINLFEILENNDIDFPIWCLSWSS